MKKLTKLNCLLLAGLLALTAFSSCQKSGVASSTDKTTSTSQLVVANGAILVAASTASTGTVATDAIYIVHAYTTGLTKDSVTFASLPAAIGTYLTANYSGYTFLKAFKISTSAGVTDSYAVVILFNGKPVGLKFDASGNFVLVYEQCEGRDLGGQGWHEGGRFGDRDGKHLDTVAISALPSAVKAYFTTNYPTDTLLHAAVNLDGSYVVISANKGLFATALTASGTLIKRIQIYPHPNNHVAVRSRVPCFRLLPPI